MMSRKDYQEFAYMLREARRWNTKEDVIRVICNLEYFMTEYFKTDNPNFDYETFYMKSRL